MLLSHVRFASPVWIGGGEQINAASAADGWTITVDSSGVFLLREDGTARWVPFANVNVGIPAKVEGVVTTVAVCRRCNPARNFENLTALRSHERHVHRVSK